MNKIVKLMAGAAFVFAVLVPFAVMADFSIGGKLDESSCRVSCNEHGGSFLEFISKPKHAPPGHTTCYCRGDRKMRQLKDLQESVGLVAEDCSMGGKLNESSCRVYCNKQGGSFSQLLPHSVPGYASQGYTECYCKGCREHSQLKGKA